MLMHPLTAHHVNVGIVEILADRFIGVLCAGATGISGNELPVGLQFNKKRIRNIPVKRYAVCFMSLVLYIMRSIARFKWIISKMLIGVHIANRCDYY